MKNYSFSNLASHDRANVKGSDLAACYRHSEIKATEANHRIEEIKKKYDTPSRRERVESLKKSQDFGVKSRAPASGDKENPSWSRESSNPNEDYMHRRPVPTFGSNPLKESFAVNRLEKSVLRTNTNCRQLQDLQQDQKKSGVSMMDGKSYSREDEEALFSKVREMKESLISKDYMRASKNNRNSTGSYKKPQPDLKPDSNHRQFDPRVQNIDKINSKIKQILSCLAENQKHPSKYMKESRHQAVLKDRAYLQTNSRHGLKQQEDVRASSLSINKEIAVHTPQGNIDPRHSYLAGKTATETYQPQRNSLESMSFIRGEARHSTDDESFSRHVTEVNIRNNETPMQEKQRQTFDSSPKHDYEKTSLNNDNNRQRAFTKTETEYCRTPTPNYTHGKHFDAKGLQASSSRSHIGVATKPVRTEGQDNDRLKSGKMLNDEISRIQSKIQEMETAKKRLNIQFTPFSMKNRSASALATGSHLHSSIESHKAREPESAEMKSVPHFRSSSTSKDRQFTAHFGNGQPSEPRFRELNLQKKDISREVMKSLSLVQDEVDIKTVRIDKDELSNEQANMNEDGGDGEEERAALEKVQRRTDDGINERRRRLSHEEDLIKTDSLKKLVALFCQQVKLDENFRNMKMWIEESSEKGIFNSLAQLITQQGTSVSAADCQAIFKVEESEHNPFFTLQGFEASAESASQAYHQASSHWVGCISHQFERGSLLGEGFTRQKMDLQRKGHIELQDLVRLLNIESGTFYRNRDIFLIFRRLTGKDKASFEELLSELCG